MYARMATKLTRVIPLALAATLAAGYSWEFAAVPAQCGTLALNITGSDGKPLYTALVIPYGDSPFQNVEVRPLFEAKFNDSSHLSVPFAYPANSQFVIVVSDSSGFGSGGASAANTVQASSDESCFDKNKPQPAPLLSMSVNSSLNACANTRIFWNKAGASGAPQGTPYFQGVIPGGDVFPIKYTNPDNESAQGLGIGFNWNVPVSAGTHLILLSADDRGYVGGSYQPVIGSGPYPDTSCLSGSSPVSTSGTPAGGAYPTSTSTSTSTSPSSSPTTSSDPSPSGGDKDGAHHSDIGTIVSGVIGGVALLALLVVLLSLRRRRRFHKQQKERPVDLTNDGLSGEDGQLLQYYRPDPFVLRGPSARGSVHLGAGDRRASANGLNAGASSRARKGRVPTPPRPVNTTQHDDGGRVPETIELPPAYSHIRRGPSARVPSVEHPPAVPVSEEGETGVHALKSPPFPHVAA